MSFSLQFWQKTKPIRSAISSNYSAKRTWLPKRSRQLLNQQLFWSWKLKHEQLIGFFFMSKSTIGQHVYDRYNKWLTDYVRNRQCARLYITQLYAHCISKTILAKLLRNWIGAVSMSSLKSYVTCNSARIPLLPLSPTFMYWEKKSLSVGEKQIDNERFIEVVQLC